MEKLFDRGDDVNKTGCLVKDGIIQCYYVM